MTPTPIGRSNLPECPLEGCLLREAREADLAAILEVERRCMQSQVERFYPGEWDEERIEKLVLENIARARVLLKEGAIVGLYYWEPEEDAIAVLLAVMLLPKHRGKGLGTWLVACFQAEARALGATRAGLAVFRESQAAKLYQKLGYRITGEDGPAALTMEKELPAES